MKQFVILMLAFMLFSCASSSVKNKETKAGPANDSDVFFNENPGQYVIYHDKRGNQDALVGFLKFNKTDYVARRYDLNSGQEIVFQFNAVKKANGEFDIKVVKVFSGNQEGVMHLLTDMFNLISQYEGYIKQGKDEVTIKDEWKEFGYTLNHSYKAWVPFFRLYKTEMAKNPKDTFTLILEGIFRNTRDYENFNLKIIPKAVKFDAFKLQKTGKDKSFKFGMFEAAIDDNWEKSGVSNEYIQSYWIKKKSLRDAHVTMEVIPSSLFGGELEYLSYRAMGFSTWVMPSTVKIEKKKNFIKMMYVVLDPETKYYTYMYDIYMKDKAGNLNSFHFSSYKDVYDLNKKYFDAIINNLKIVQ
ncbi:MAG: hypothetical protein CVV49_15820 [Spirochaetae bacterium HGW-Spirochaetae-5]|nr:MAG: hypothetical protein CVV49_15820 [Spirochaetae bacterium HGW-Spirochaetae-5]